MLTRESYISIIAYDVSITTNLTASYLISSLHKKEGITTHEKEREMKHTKTEKCWQMVVTTCILYRNLI